MLENDYYDTNDETQTLKIRKTFLQISGLQNVSLSGQQSFSAHLVERVKYHVSRFRKKMFLVSDMHGELRKNAEFRTVWNRREDYWERPLKNISLEKIATSSTSSVNLASNLTSNQKSVPLAMSQLTCSSNPQLGTTIAIANPPPSRVSANTPKVRNHQYTAVVRCARLKLEIVTEFHIRVPLHPKRNDRWSQSRVLPREKTYTRHDQSKFHGGRCFI
jgi:hypothetical protein